jgi:hypothetical protein
MLRTTFGGYEVFNLTSEILAAFFKRGDDLTAQANGVATLFTATDPYVADTLVVTIGGIRQANVVETNPATGTFTLPYAPDPVVNPLQDSPVLADYVKG